MLGKSPLESASQDSLKSLVVTIPVQCYPAAENVWVGDQVPHILDPVLTTL